MSILPLAEPARRGPAPGQIRPGRATGPTAPRPARQLRVVAPRRRAARAPFIVLVSLILGGGLLFLLLINTWLAAGSFTIQGLQSTQAGLADQQQALTQTIAGESTPQQIAQRATALGLVPAPNPVFKRANGAVLGVPTQAVVPPKPVPSASSALTTPTTPAAANSKASASASAQVKPAAVKPVKTKPVTTKAVATRPVTTTKGTPVRASLTPLPVLPTRP